MRLSNSKSESASSPNSRASDPVAASASSAAGVPTPATDPPSTSSDPSHSLRPLRALVVDDDAADSEALISVLRDLHCRVIATTSYQEAIERIRTDVHDVAFLDLMIGEEDGADLVPVLINANTNLQIVVITAFGSIDSAVRAVKAGASEYIRKPLDPEQIGSLVRRITEERRLAAGMSAFERRGGTSGSFVFSSRSVVMQPVLSVIRQASTANVPVLLRGESGTGKGVMAEALHRQSARSAKPILTVNCPTLSNELLSSELFGHVKGAFTGAIRDQTGKIEAADGGTLFLDELGDLSATVQAKLLRFLQEHTYERIGDTQTRHADVRIVAATNRDLETSVREGRFREDLLYRLNVIEVTMPPLRNRPEDIMDLAWHLLAMFCVAADRPMMTFSQAAQELLTSYAWPGNIRELRNEIQRLTVLWPTRTADVDAFSPRINPNPSPRPRLGGDHSLNDIKNEHILQILAKTDTFEEAATLLGIEPSTLWRKRRQLEL